MRFLILASTLLALAFTGCQTPHSFSMPDSSWKAHVGQLKFSNRKRTLIGDVVVQQRGDKDFQLDFIKGGGLPLISLRQDASQSHIEGLLAHRGWTGSADAAPRPIQPWLKLRDTFAHPPAGKSARAEAKFTGGKLTMLFVAFPDDDQRFVFQFNQ